MSAMKFGEYLYTLAVLKDAITHKGWPCEMILKEWDFLTDIQSDIRFPIKGTFDQVWDYFVDARLPEPISSVILESLLRLYPGYRVYQNSCKLDEFSRMGNPEGMQAFALAKEETLRKVSVLYTEEPADYPYVAVSERTLRRLTRRYLKKGEMDCIERGMAEDEGDEGDEVQYGSPREYPFVLETALASVDWRQVT